MRVNKTRLFSCLSALFWCVLPTLAGTPIVGPPSTIVWGGGPSPWVYTFAIGNDRQLYVNYGPFGQQGQWASLGGWQLNVYVSAITYTESGTQKIDVFVVGGDGNLYKKYWNGSGWFWGYLGNPGVQLQPNIKAITYNDGGSQQTMVFGVGTNGQLFAWNEAQWGWANLGGTNLRPELSAISYSHDNQRSVRVYVIGGDRNLYVRYSENGAGWQWTFLSRPQQNVSVAFPSAIHWIPDMQQAAYENLVYTTGGDGSSYVYREQLGQWVYEGGSQLSSSSAAFIAGNDEYALIVGGDGYVYYTEDCFGWDDYLQSRCMGSRPMPDAGTNLTWYPSAVGFTDGGIVMFAVGGNGHLFEGWATGHITSGNWLDHGTPP